MKKRMLPGLVAVVLAVSACVVVWAQPAAPDKLEVKGSVSCGAIMAPIRNVFTYLGYTVSWDPKTDAVHLENAAGVLTLEPGKTEASYRAAADGKVATATLPAAPKFVGRLLCGPMEALWGLAGAQFKMASKTDLAADYLFDGKRIIIKLISQEEKAIVDQAKGSVVKLETSKGDILLELFDDKTPVTVGSFLDLVGKGFYDGLSFHRVIANFMIQGGDPLGTGSGGPGFTIPDEADKGLKHVRGSLSMAKTARPNSGGSQCFICHSPQKHLDGVHTVFGQCVQGMEVVDAIEQGDIITSATIVKKSDKADADIEAATKARVADR